MIRTLSKAVLLIFSCVLVPHMTLAVDTAGIAEPQWTQSQLRVLRSLSLAALGPVPDNPSNKYARDERAVRFGEQLFFDQRFSANGKLSCAGCHRPERHFTDGLPRAQGVGAKATGRNTPTVVGAAYLGWFYWDGRRDSLWAQALIPFEAANEMGMSRLSVLRLVGQDDSYRSQYEALFGAFPDQLLAPDLPLQAGPYGDSTTRDNWFHLPASLRRTINEALANVGKAIAAYERTLLPTPTPFDAYVASRLATTPTQQAKDDNPILTPDQIAGLRLFIDSNKTQCLQCHNGPLLSNGGFHNIGTGNFTGPNLDFGRVFGLQAVLRDEFNCLGPYSDAAPEQCSELRFLNPDQHIPLHGAFKTPGLRNLKATAPYFHDGSMKDLASVLRHYNEPPDAQSGVRNELRALGLNERELRQLEAFLEALSP